MEIPLRAGSCKQEHWCADGLNDREQAWARLHRAQCSFPVVCDVQLQVQTQPRRWRSLRFWASNSPGSHDLLAIGWHPGRYMISILWFGWFIRIRARAVPQTREGWNGHVHDAIHMGQNLDLDLSFTYTHVYSGRDTHIMQHIHWPGGSGGGGGRSQ